MMIRFVDFEVSDYKGLYVRISVIGTTVPVNERSIYFLYPVISIGCTKLLKLLASKIALLARKYALIKNNGPVCKLY